MRTLFCIIGNLRAGDLPVKFYEQFFEDKTDLLLCTQVTYPDSKWRSKAKYIYELNDSPDVWFDIYDSVSTKWRDINHLVNMWGPYKGLHGSGMIVCALRQELYQFIKDSNIKYDRYVVTRSDHAYFSDFIPEVEPNTVYIPNGEEYGGVTDRHMVCDHDTLMKVLPIIQFIQDNNNFGNIEQALFYFIKSLNINLVKTKRTMYVIARENEQYTWMPPQLNFPTDYPGYYLKYPTEIYTAIQDNQKLSNVDEPLNLFLEKNKLRLEQNIMIDDDPPIENELKGAEPLSENLMEQIKYLVEDVEIDLDSPLAEEDN